MCWGASCDGIESWVLRSIYSEIQSEIVYVGVNKYYSTDRCSYPAHAPGLYSSAVELHLN